MREYNLVPFSQIDPESLLWLWYERIPLGKISLLVGNPGIGKSVLSMYIAAQVSRGAEWPDQPCIREGTFDEEIGDYVGDGVIILTTEDDLNDTVRVRLEAADANLSNIYTLTVKKTYKGEESEEPIYNLIDSLDLLEQAIKDKGNIALVILDPITGYMGTLNSNSNTEVRSFLNMLKILAEKYEVAVLGISHLNKNSELEAAYRILGSIGFNAGARSVWMVISNPADEDSRLLLPVKGNVGKNPKGLEFKLVSTEVDTADGTIESVRCAFERDTVYRTADEVLAEEKKKQRAPVKHSIKRWLEDVLKNGAVDVKVIESKAAKDSIGTRTLRRAKEDMNIKSKKEGNKWIWMLPKKEE